MDDSSLILGVPAIDDDHRKIENMFAEAARAESAQLPTLFSALEKELGAHFAREEKLMTDNGFPGLHCHLAQHNSLESEMRRGRAMVERGRLAELRRHLSIIMPQLVISHIGTMDRMTAAFLKGEFGASAFAPLRLPVENATP